MSRSLVQSGELLRDNVYGHHAAIHNFYLLLAFSPLTVPLGAYGLILGLVLLHLAAVVRIALATTLDLPGRVALLGGYLSPIAYAVFDNPVFGFHPELCYPPLALLLALDLREGRSRRAILVAALMVLVKEDGAVLCACVLVAFFAPRLWALRAAAPEERRPVASAAARSLLAATLAFAAGMVLLWVMGRTLTLPQETAEVRVLDSLPERGPRRRRPRCAAREPSVGSRRLLRGGRPVPPPPRAPALPGSGAPARVVATSPGGAPGGGRDVPLPVHALAPSARGAPGPRGRLPRAGPALFHAPPVAARWSRSWGCSP